MSVRFLIYDCYLMWIHQSWLTPNLLNKVHIGLDTDPADRISASLVASPLLTQADAHVFLCLCLYSAKKEASLMICGWVWVLKTCLSTRKASPSLWRPSHTSTSFSLALHSRAPTRSLWMREKCSLKHRRYITLCADIGFHMVDMPDKTLHMGNKL